MILNTELYKKFRSIDKEKLTEEDKEDLLRIFKVVKNSLIRDWISFIFADLKYDKSVSSIIEKINSKENFNNNSSLVLSLKELDTRGYFVEVVKILLSNGYEARQLAYEIILSNIQSVSEQERREGLRILISEAKSTGDKESNGFSYVERAIEILRETLKKSQ